MAPLTGNDVADLHQACDQHKISYYTIDVLPVPYILDMTKRAIYVDGRLAVERYFEALARAVVRLVRYLAGPNVVPIRPRAWPITTPAS